MTKVSFSVAESVKREFQATFAGENKSAIITRLMQRAIDERRRQEQQSEAIDKLLELRRHAPPATDAEIRRARRRGRP